MPKVILNKTTKIKGKGLILAGIEVEVTDAEKKALEKNGFIGEVKKTLAPTNEKDIKGLATKVIELEKQIKENGDNSILLAEIETLKADLEAKDAEIETLKADLEVATATVKK